MHLDSRNAGGRRLRGNVHGVVDPPDECAKSFVRIIQGMLHRRCKSDGSHRESAVSSSTHDAVKSTVLNRQALGGQWQTGSAVPAEGRNHGDHRRQ
jgi:hypothetical protein